MAKSKKTNKKTTTNKKGRTNNTKQIKNNNDLVFKIVTSIVVIGILCIVFNYFFCKLFRSISIYFVISAV